MDKINIKFNENNIEYCYRIPTNLDWFEIKRWFGDYKYQSVIYNSGKLFYDKFVIDENWNKKTYLMTKSEQENLKNTFIKKAIEHNINKDIINYFADCLNVSKYNAINSFDLETFEREFDNKFKFIDNDNPYNILGISEKDYTKEELLEIVKNRTNQILDAYNSIIKQKKLKK